MKVTHISIPDKPPVPSLLSTIAWKYPDIDCFAYGDLYQDIVFRSGNVSESQLKIDRIEYTKFLFIQASFERANLLQEQASSYHAISRKTVSTQIDIYRLKYQAATQYLSDIDENGIQSALIPAIIKNEADAVHQDPVEICNGIIQNYVASNESLSAYFGQVEGYRRLLKRKILECTSLYQLMSLKWDDWPEYVPTIGMDLDA